jgi:hypothetical protein
VQGVLSEKAYRRIRQAETKIRSEALEKCDEPEEGARHSGVDRDHPLPASVCSKREVEGMPLLDKGPPSVLGRGYRVGVNILTDIVYRYITC